MESTFKISSLVNRFLPDWYFEKKKQENIIVPILIVLKLLTILFIFAYFIYCIISFPDNYIKHTTNFLGIILVSGTLFWVKRTKTSIRFPLMVMNTVGFIFTCISIYDTGGIYSVDFFWLVLLIIISLLLVDIKLGLIQAGATIVIVFALYFVNLYSNNSFADIPKQNEGVHALFTIPFLVVLLTAFLVIYKKMFTKLQQELENAKETKIEALDHKIEELTSEMDSLRANLAQDFHDEFGNKLAGMSMLSFELRNVIDSENKEFALDIIDKISDYSQDIYNSGKDFIWSIKNIQLSPEELFRYITDFGNDLFNFTNISFISKRYDLRDDTSIIENTFDIVLFLKEALTNTYKHSKATKVHFIITQKGNMIEFGVIDNGKGYNLKTIKLGTGLESMKQRALKVGATQIVESTTTGTVIKLQVKGIS